MCQGRTATQNSAQQFRRENEPAIYQPASIAFVIPQRQKEGQRPCNPNLKGRLILRKRDVHVQLWLNQKEAEALTRNAERCRLTQSAYLRHLIMGYAPREAPPPDYHAMMQQIYHVGRSLNQIATKAHVLM